MVRRALVGVVVAIAAGVAAPVAPAAGAGYFDAPFSLSTHAASFGQAPVFMPGRRVAFGQDFKQGDKNQVYVENWNGTGLKCLTCAGDPVQNDPNNVNGVPAVRPGGDWILFHSWRGHYVTIGSAGYGGMGSALWAMHPDGSDQTQLTDVQPAGTTPGNGDGYDDYHAYWSPDGTKIEYAHLNWNFVTGGGSGKWDVRVADFHVGQDGKPYLSNTHVVRPANGHWYETQWWAPDGSGFLYTETYPSDQTGSGQSTVPQLFFCHLVKHDTACDVHRLTDDPAWDEQAIFTPDMKDVIFMSSRAQPGFFNTWAQTARTLGLPNDYDYMLILPLFEAGFLQPAGQEATDLYEVPLNDPSKVRRLTTDGNDGWITPEFTWDPSNKCLVWTENRLPDGYRYQFPPVGWAAQVKALLSNPPNPNQVVDVGQNGVGVAPFPIQQRTRIGVFGTTTTPSCH
jgi:Tol biopolymer transport system component